MRMLRFVCSGSLDEKAAMHLKILGKAVEKKKYNFTLSTKQSPIEDFKFFHKKEKCLLSFCPTLIMKHIYQQGSQLALCRAEIAHLVSSLICFLCETFRWDLKWDVLFKTFQTYHGGLLIWNFQMTLEMRCAISNFWTHHRGCLFETFRWDLK